MRIHPSPTNRLILIAALMSSFGCGNQDARNLSSLVGPNTQAAHALTADPSATRILLPFDPGNFGAGVQNPFYPLVPGNVLTYRQQTPDGVEINTVEVTHNTKTILGVRTTVVHDQVFLEGALKEDTFDWLATDKDGNVWYFGEDTKELGPPVSTVGSWEAGQNGAHAGIIMLAHPAIGDTYLQENAPGVVADQARVKSVDETVTVPYGTFSGCIKTQEWTPIEPGDRAFKVYASGIGPILEIPNRGGDPVELTAVAP